MRRDIIIGATLALIAIVGIAAYILLKPAPAQAPGAITLPATGYSEHTKQYDITASYATSTPLLASAGALADATARSLMYGFIRDTIVRFKTDSDLDTSRKETLTITYRVVSSARSVSYIYTVYEDTSGAPASTSFTTFTFDSKTGAPL